MWNLFVSLVKCHHFFLLFSKIQSTALFLNENNNKSIRSIVLSLCHWIFESSQRSDWMHLVNLNRSMSCQLRYIRFNRTTDIIFRDKELIYCPSDSEHFTVEKVLKNNRSARIDSLQFRIMRTMQMMRHFITLELESPLRFHRLFKTPESMQ